jgi:3-oxoacyl-[acyl-carrier-protein] synthase-3
MKVEQLFIAGLDTYLPPPVDVQEAIADGRYDLKDHAKNGLDSVLVAGRESAPEMAIQAARGALTRSGVQARDLSLILHACVYLQGLEFFSMQAYIHNALLSNPSPPSGSLPTLILEVRGCCNGGMASLELASTYLAAAPEHATALITTSDKFCPPYVDRWRPGAGIVFADGATAMVLSKRSGFARVLSVATATDSTLEGIHRGHDPFAPTPAPIDLLRRKRAFLAEFDVEDMKRRVRLGLRTAVDRALHDAQTELADIARFAVPHVSRILLEAYLDELKIPESRTTWQLGRRTSHLGAGDQIASLSLMMDLGMVKPGDRCLLMSLGAGFIWTFAVVEILERLPLRPCPLFS